MPQQVVNSQVGRILLRFYAGFKITEADVRRCFSKKSLFKNFANFTGKQLRQSLFFQQAPWHRCFPFNFVKFLRAPFFIENLWRLLLKIETCKLSLISACKYVLFTV